MKTIEFDPIEHKYSIDGKRLTSVTEFIKTFFEPFDRDYWANYKAEEQNKTTEEILEQWKTKRDWGSEVHGLIDNHLKGNQKDNYPVEVIEALKFLELLPKGKIESEIIVHSEELGLAGTIDVAIETPEGVMLFDWKTTSNLRTENSYRQCKSPIAHLDDCNYNVYNLQLNLYKLLFEELYGKKVIEMGFVKLSGDGACEYYPVEDLSRELGLMMDYWNNPSEVDNGTWVRRVLGRIGFI